MLGFVYGTRFAEMQIAASLQMCSGLEDLVHNLPNSESKLFCDKLLSRTHKCEW